MTYHKKSLYSRGFTIVELLIVIVVIAILAAISIVAYNGVQNRAKDTVMRTQIAHADEVIKVYVAEHGTPPTVDMTDTYTQNIGEALTDSDITLPNDIANIQYVSYGDTDQYCAVVWDAQLNIVYVLTNSGTRKITSLSSGQVLCSISDKYGIGSFDYVVTSVNPLSIGTQSTGA